MQLAERASRAHVALGPAYTSVGGSKDGTRVGDALSTCGMYTLVETTPHRARFPHPSRHAAINIAVV